MMTAIEKTELAKLYSATCRAFDKVLDSDVLKLQIEDLADLDFKSCVQALHEYRRNPKNVFWPKASKIREIVEPELSPEAEANEVASRIRGAISIFGWPNPGAARLYIGELGWTIVNRCGGWNYVCENHGVDLNPLTFHAQARDQAKAIRESVNLGIFNQPIAIEFENKKDPDMILNDTKRESVLALVEHMKKTNTISGE